MLERQIEQRLVRKVKSAGGIAYKFTSPSRRSVPDRIVLMPPLGPPRARVADAVLASSYGRAIFVELKAPGKKPTPAQSREHDMLRGMGFRVEVLDSYDAVDRFVEGLL